MSKDRGCDLQTSVILSGAEAERRAKRSRRAEALRDSAGEDAGGAIPWLSGCVVRDDAEIALPGGLIVLDLLRGPSTARPERRCAQDDRVETGMTE